MNRDQTVRWGEEIAGRCLNSFPNLAASEATGAHSDPHCGAVHDRTHPLKIRIKRALCLIVGMTDVVASLMFL